MSHPKTSVDRIIQKKVSREEEFSHTSKNLPVLPNKKYSVKLKVKPKVGKPYCVFFGVFLIDKNDREVTRFIKWINEFNSIEKEYSIIFTTPYNAENAKIGIRINNYTPVKSDVEIQIPNPSLITLEETKEQRDSFDKFNDFTVPFEPLTEEEEENLEKNLVWVFGSVRGGTTWVGRDLLRHPKNILWFEPKIATQFKTNTRIVGREIGEPEYKMPSFKNLEQPSYLFCKQHQDTWIPHVRKLVLARAYSHAQTIKKNIIIKEPIGTENLTILMRCFPKSKLIFLTRDGRDVVDSKFDRHTPDSWAIKRGQQLLPLNETRRRKRMVRMYSSVWNVCMNNIFEVFEKHDPKLRILVKYEDLLKNTTEELRRIYDFLNLTIDNKIIENTTKRADFKNIPDSKKGTGKIYRSASPGKWKNNFSKDEQNLMNSLMGDTLKKFNYTI